MASTTKRLISFIVLSFIGMTGAKWALDAVGMQEVGTTNAVIFFVIPVAVVFYLWDRWGDDVAQAM